jgi:hypothetical protein
MAHAERLESADPVSLRLLIDVAGAPLAGVGRAEHNDRGLRGDEVNEPIAQRWLEMLGDLEAVREVERAVERSRDIPAEIQALRSHALAPRKPSTDPAVLTRLHTMASTLCVGCEGTAPRPDIQESVRGRKSSLQCLNDARSVGPSLFLIPGE